MALTGQGKTVMAETELEQTLASLRTEVARLRAQDEDRAQKARTIVKATTGMSILFVVAFIGILVAAEWLGSKDMMAYAYPLLFTSIALNFVNMAVGIWRAEPRAKAST